MAEDSTILPRHQSTQGATALDAAVDLLNASVGLAKALELMPAPMWEVLNDRHLAEEHEALSEFLTDCVPCQFDRVLSAARMHDALAQPTSSTPPLDFSALFPPAGPHLALVPEAPTQSTPTRVIHKLEGSRTGQFISDEPAVVDGPYTEAEVRVAKWLSDHPTRPVSAADEPTEVWTARDDA